MSLDTIILSEYKSLSKNSTPKKLDIDQMYKMSIKVIGKSGKPFCGYAGIVFLENDTEIQRKICWFNDFSGQTKTHQIIFKAITSKVILIYRINNETPIKTECNFEVTTINDIIIEKTIDTKEKFDKIEDYIIPRPKELSIEEEDKVEKNIVWVLGSPRGGTTWVGTQLLSYNTNIIDESQIGLHIGATGGGNEYIIRDIDHFRETPQYIFSKTYENTWLYYLRKLILNRIFAQFPDATEKITVIKEPTGTLVADIISKCLPNSKIIFLLRDGRDVIDSTLNAYSKEGWMAKELGVYPLSTKEKRLEFLEKWSRHWVKRTEIMMETLKSHNKELTYLVKYEDVRKNLRPRLEELYKIMGVEISEDELAKIVEKYTFENIPEKLRGEGKFYRSASPGKWKKNLSNEEQSIMNNIMKEMLSIVGYE